MKRLELRLPEGHPIWQVPAGQRAEVARRWLELGREAELAREGVETRLARVEEKLAALEVRVTRLEAGGVPGGQGSGGVKKPDAGKFLAAF